MTTEDDIMVLARRSLKTGGRSSLGEILLVEDVKIISRDDQIAK